MQQRHIRILIGILIIAVVAVWIDWPSNPGIHIDFMGIKINRDIKISEGLDLQGGTQVVLQADVPPGQPVSADAMQAAKGIVENRVNGLGVSEPLIQTQGSNRIIVELPGIKDPEAAIKTFGQTGLLEFIDAGNTPLQTGELVTTTLGGPASIGVAIPSSGVVTGTASAGGTPTPPTKATPGGSPTPGVTATPTASPSPTASPTASPSPTLSPSATKPTTGTLPLTTQPTTTVPSATQPTTGTVPSTTGGPVFKTIMTGKDLKTASVGFDQLGNVEIDFELTAEGSKLFSQYTSTHVGQYMAITMDKQVISSPVIQEAIPGPKVSISNPNAGGIPLDEAKSIVIQLKYGALPIPLKVVTDSTVGPTLGADSVSKSWIAGIIGLTIVVAFMLVYYRLPGLLADVALGIYAATVFALFKMIPVTLTLAGIAGFVLSIGMAVDANILIFERMKEELRTGRTLGSAIEAGFARAWTSIRDSNISTLITCAILFWFGSNFGASIIQGFALTLAIGVLVSMFTAVVVTRNFLRAVQEVWFSDPNAVLGPRVRWLFDLSGARRYGESADNKDTATS